MTHTEAIIECRRSGMILHIYSNSYYISESEAQSRAYGYFFLGPKSNTQIQSMPLENGSVHAEYIIMRNAMASVTEEELGGIFENFQKAMSTRTALAEIVHPKPLIPLATDNTSTD